MTKYTLQEQIVFNGFTYPVSNDITRSSLLLLIGMIVDYHREDSLQGASKMTDFHYQDDAREYVYSASWSVYDYTRQFTIKKVQE